MFLPTSLHMFVGHRDLEKLVLVSGIRHQQLIQRIANITPIPKSLAASLKAY